MDADLAKIVEVWAAQCGLVEFGCGCAPGDFRPVVLELVRELQERRDECARLQQLLSAAAFKQPATGAQIKAFLRGQETPPAFDAGTAPRTTRRLPDEEVPGGWA